MRTRLRYLLTLLFAITLILAMVNWSIAAEVPSQADPFPIKSYLPIVTNETGEIVIPPTTEVLSESTTDALINVSPDGSVLTFDSAAPAIDDIDVGDVIVSQPTNLLPEGSLRKVTSISNGAAGEVILSTEQASLTEAIDTGSITYVHQLDPSRVRHINAVPGVTLVPSTRANDKTFEIVFDEVAIYDNDGNDNTKGDQIVVNGKMTFTNEFSFDLDIDNKELKKLEFTTHVETSSELEVIAKFAAVQLDEERTIWEFYLTPITIWIGPVPVVLTPVLTGVVGIDGSIHVGVKASVEPTVSYVAGLRYVNGNWQPISEEDAQFNYTLPTLTAEMSARVYTGPELLIKLYGVVGPGTGTEMGLELEADPFDKPWWKLYGGLQVIVAVKVEIFKKTLADEELTVIHVRELLAQAQSGPPYVPSGPTPVDKAVNQPVNLTLAWLGGDPDGDQVSYDVFLEIGDATPDILQCDNVLTTHCSSNTLAPNTIYYWQVVASTSNGDSTVGPVWSFSTGNGSNQAPYKPSNPSPAHNAKNAPLSLMLGWAGGDPNGDAVTYDVYFEKGDSTPDLLICDNAAGTTCNPGNLTTGSTYYWQVVSTDSKGATTQGDVWTFDTVTQSNEPATMDIAIIIDSSGSMAWNDPANLRLDAAKVFAGVMLNGDQAAVVGFDTNAYVRFGLQPLTNNRSAIMSAISSISSSGGSTNIVAGLNVAYAQLNGSTKSVPKAAVLLTDGQHNQGAWNASSYTQYAAKGWPVFTIGLGSEADEIRLKQIASATGGQYYKLSDPSQLVQVYYAIQAAITGSSIITSSSFNLQQGQTETLNSAVSSNQNSVSFVTTWPGSQVDVTLQDPSGRVITPNTPSSDPNVYHSKGATYEVYRVDYPPQGTWKVMVYGAILDPGGETVTVQVAQRDDQLPSGVWQEVSPGSASGAGISNTGDDSIRPAIAAAPDGSIYAVWAEDVGSQAEIYVLRWNGSAWTTVGSGSASGGGISKTSGKSEDPEIAIDSNGMVYVSWQDKGGNDTDIYVRRWNGSQWTEVGAGSASGEGVSKTNTNSFRAAIEVAPDNSVYLVWVEEEASDNEIYIRRWNGSSWNPVGTNANGGLSNNSGDSGGPAIVITDQGVPYVAWTDASTGDTEVYVRSWDGTAWKEVGAGSATGGGISNNSGASRAPTMTADSLGRIYVIWPDNTNGTFNIMVRRWNGSSWTEVGTGSASGGGISQSSGDTFTPHAAIGTDDIPYVVWFGKPLGSADVFTPEIYARRWNGTFWEEVGTGSATGGGISSSNGASAHASIAIAPNNVPYVIWDDNSSGNYEIYVKVWSK